MKKIIVALVALTSPAFALDYDCSPMTGGCTPRASQPSVFDPPYPSTYVPRDRCTLVGPSAWTCDRDRERRGGRR
jgi:hypothetical protein